MEKSIFCSCYGLDIEYSPAPQDSALETSPGCGAFGRWVPVELLASLAASETQYLTPVTYKRKGLI